VELQLQYAMAIYTAQSIATILSVNTVIYEDSKLETLSRLDVPVERVASLKPE
jgi:hypothetical protein